MKIAIMQPYFFPYIGYFQLINAVDKFVIYDDVNYINKGWINRNNLLINAESSLFTVPLSNASQNRKINEIALAEDKIWKAKLLKKISFSYAKAPFFGLVFSLIEQVILFDTTQISILNTEALKKICSYLHIHTEFVESSAVYGNASLKGQDRILDVCKWEKATHYFNPIGGMELYDRVLFAQNDIELKFVQSKSVEYPQFGHSFVPWLSIIDVIMFNSIEDVNRLLNSYKLIPDEKQP
jgi:hypothetical protein